MNLDDLLADALHDDRWAVPVSPDTLPAVRRARARRRAARTTVGALAAVGAVTGAVLLLPGSRGDQGRSVVRPAATPPPPSGCEAAPAGRLPGSDYVVRSARDWFMTKTVSEAFFATYRQPSPKPGDTVPSPHATGPGSDRLVAAATAAGVPGADQLDRDEADSGDRDSPSLKGHLADGRELTVYRRPLGTPLNRDGIGIDGSEPNTSVEDVPGSSCAALLFVGNPGQPGGYFVMVATPDGTSTTWGSQDIPLAQLKQWAYAAAQWETEHPAS